MSLLDKILGRSSTRAEEPIAEALDEMASKSPKVVKKTAFSVRFGGKRAISSEEFERIAKALGVAKGTISVRMESGKRAASSEELERITKALGEGAKVVENSATGVRVELDGRAPNAGDLERIVQALNAGAGPLPKIFQTITRSVDAESGDGRSIDTAGIGDPAAGREPWGGNETRPSFLRDHGLSLMLGGVALVFAILSFGKAAPEPEQLTEVSGKLLQVERTVPQCAQKIEVCGPVIATIENAPGRYRVRPPAALLLWAMRNTGPVVGVYAEKRPGTDLADDAVIETWGLSIAGRKLVPLEEALSRGGFMRRTVFPSLAVLLAALAVARFPRE